MESYDECHALVLGAVIQKTQLAQCSASIADSSEGVLKGINCELQHSGSPLAPLKKGGNRTQSPPFSRGI
jgi:hypothetical protein